MGNQTSQTEAKYKKVILINDLDCLTAIMYKYGIEPSFMLKDGSGIYWTLLADVDKTEKAMKCYYSGKLSIDDINKYRQFIAEFISEYTAVYDSFDTSNNCTLDLAEDNLVVEGKK